MHTQAQTLESRMISVHLRSPSHGCTLPSPVIHPRFARALDPGLPRPPGPAPCSRTPCFPSQVRRVLLRRVASGLGCSAQRLDRCLERRVEEAPSPTRDFSALRTEPMRLRKSSAFCRYPCNPRISALSLEDIPSTRVAAAGAGRSRRGAGWIGGTEVPAEAPVVVTVGTGMFTVRGAMLCLRNGSLLRTELTGVAVLVRMCGKPEFSGR